MNLFMCSPRRSQLPSAERLSFVNVARRGQEPPELIDAHSILICCFWKQTRPKEGKKKRSMWFNSKCGSCCEETVWRSRLWIPETALQRLGPLLQQILSMNAYFRAGRERRTGADFEVPGTPGVQGVGTLVACTIVKVNKQNKTVFSIKINNHFVNRAVMNSRNQREGGCRRDWGRSPW